MMAMLSRNLVAGLCCFALVLPVQAERFKVVGYYPLWRMEPAPLDQLPLERLTHLNLAFAHIGTLGDCRLSDDEPERDFRRKLATRVASIRNAYPQLKIIMSVGGWNRSSRFSDIAAAPNLRQQFVASCAEAVETLKLDGVDIDWEFPVARWEGDESGRAEDRDNFPKLLALLADAIDRDGTDRLLTCAVSAKPHHLKHIDLKAMLPHVDWLNLMTYDLWGSWVEQTGFHAALDASKLGHQPSANVRAHVAAILAAGIEPQRVVLGIPFYGRGVVRAAESNFGLFQPHGGPAPGTDENELFTYADLVENYFPKLPSYWDEDATAGWLYNADNGLMISFEDARSIKAKLAFVREQKLGGVMVWEITMDVDGRHSLLTTIQEGLAD